MAIPTDFLRAEVGISAIIEARHDFQNSRQLDRTFKVVSSPHVLEVETAQCFVELLESQQARIMPVLSEDRANKLYQNFVTFAQDVKGMDQDTFTQLVIRVKKVLAPLTDKLNQTIECILQKPVEAISKKEAELLHEKLVSLALNRELVESISLFAALKTKKTSAEIRAFHQQKNLQHLAANEEMLTAEESAFFSTVPFIGMRISLNRIPLSHASYRNIVLQILNYQERRPERNCITDLFLHILEEFEWMSYGTDVRGLHGWLFTFIKMVAPNLGTDWARFCKFGGSGLKFHDSFAEFNGKIIRYGINSEHLDVNKHLAILYGVLPSDQTFDEKLATATAKGLQHLSTLAKMEKDFCDEVTQLYKLYKANEPKCIKEYNRISAVLKAFRSNQPKPADFLYLANYPAYIETMKKERVLPTEYQPVVYETLIPKTVIESAKEWLVEIKVQSAPRPKPPVEQVTRKLKQLTLPEEPKPKVYPLDLRVARWLDPNCDPFSDPDYKKQMLSDVKKRLVRIQHSFDRLVDPYILKQGLQTTERSASRNTDNKHFSLAGALKFEGRLIRGRYSICIGPEGSIYHRHFEENSQTKNHVRIADSEKQFFNIDFPALEMARQERRKLRKAKDPKLQREVSAEVTKETEIFIKIKDYLNKATYYLYPKID